MSMTIRGTLLAASAILAIANAAPAAAQNQGAGTQAADDPNAIPDVTITARQVQETLQDAPVSVSVVTSDLINARGLNSIDDFARNSTGISFSQAFGRSTDRPVIRGQSNVLAGVQAGVETGAAYFVDGIYYQGDIQGFDPQSIERVEIIKGPQSALYGRNTYAGAINYITRDPSRDFTVSGRLRGAEHDEYEAAVSVSGPIIPDVLGFRAGGRFFTYGGEYRNQLTGTLVGDEETISAYATLLFQPTPDIRIRPRIMYQRDDDGPLALFLQGSAANNCRPGFRSPNYRTASPFIPGAPALLVSSNTNQYYCGVIQPQPNGIQLNTDPVPVTAALGTRDGTAYDGVYNRQILITNTAEWDIGGSGWVVSSLTGYRRNTNLFGTDSDHSNAFVYFGAIPAPNTDPEPAFANTNRDEQRDFSQEIRISSPQDRPLRGTLGVYYFSQNFQSTDITFASGRSGLALGTDLSQRATIRNRAIFGRLQWQPVEELTLSGELRYAEERKTLIDRSSATAAGIFCAGAGSRVAQFSTGLPAGQVVTCRPEGVFDGWDPRFTIDYQPNPNWLFYGVFARGRKPGGFNGTAGVTAATQTGQASFINYLPEVSTGGEVGIKWDSSDRRVRASIAAFYNELSDVQLTSAIPNPNGTGAITSIVTNSGDARAAGIEIEFQVRPARGLDIGLNFSYVSAQFTRGCDSDEFILNSGGLRPNFDTRNPTPAGLALCTIEGRRLPLGSPLTINGSASYETSLPGSNLTLFTNANFSFEDSKFIQVDNLAETGDTFLLNGRIGIRGEHWSVSLFGRNLTDEDSITLATRWFDLRYGAGTRNLPPAAGVTFDGRPAQIETGSPRGFFGALRRGRTFGLEATFNF
jgi:outer membrane receptor protein involved in Fe transport